MTSAGSSRCGGVVVVLWVAAKWLNFSPSSKKKASDPLEMAHFCFLYLWSHSFSYYPELVTIGGGRDTDRLVKWQLPFYTELSFTTMEWYSNHITSDTLTIPLSISYFPLSWIRPEVLEFLHFERKPAPHSKQALHSSADNPGLKIRWANFHFHRFTLS